MKTLWIDSQFEYDGSQLRSLFAYLEYGILGDSMVAWVGPCQIPFDKMVDGEDKRLGAEIRGAQMVHFIGEFHNASLLAGVALQRLMASMVKDVMLDLSSDKALALRLRRDGDDLYVGENKLSISIATASPTSTLLHFAVNAVNRGTPVPTISLEEFAIDAKVFSQEVLSRFQKEYESVVNATQKVHWVR
ncbi:MAG: DUF366 family protein [Bdellovibrionales bacterium]|nr:DUF366 family protein [Bdellovibrionales bacterium]